MRISEDPQSFKGKGPGDPFDLFLISNPVWDQFGTTVEHALEVLSNFDNDGHRVQFGSTSNPAIELLTYFDKGGHLNQFGTTV